MSQAITLTCPDCGARLEDSPSYRLACPNNCIEDMEQWQWEELHKEREMQ